MLADIASSTPKPVFWHFSMTSCIFRNNNNLPICALSNLLNPEFLRNSTWSMQSFAVGNFSNTIFLSSFQLCRNTLPCSFIFLFPFLPRHSLNTPLAARTNMRCVFCLLTTRQSERKKKTSLHIFKQAVRIAFAEIRREANA